MMAAKKIGIILIILFLIFVFMISGCASTNGHQEQRYKPPAQETYICPLCYSEIPLCDIRMDSRAVNTCPHCHRRFPYSPPHHHEEKGNYHRPQYRGYGGAYGPSTRGYSHTRSQTFQKGGYTYKESPPDKEGPVWFSESYWYFRDRDVDRDYVRSRWRTTRRYRYP